MKNYLKDRLNQVVILLGVIAVVLVAIFSRIPTEYNVVFENTQISQTQLKEKEERIKAMLEDVKGDLVVEETPKKTK